MKTNGLKRYFKGDSVIWIIIVLLSLLSLLVVYSATSSLAYRRYGGNTMYFLTKQAVFLLLGIVVVWLVHIVHYRWFKYLSVPCLLIAVLLLIITITSDNSLNQASRWYLIPGLDFSFQTSDFAKIALVMYVATMLATKQHEINNLRHSILPTVLPIVLICALILPENLSTAVMLGLTCFVLMFVARVKVSYLLAISGIGILFFALFLFISKEFGLKHSRAATWGSRIEAFMGGGDDEDNFQVSQSKIAIATGGIFGKGPGQSTQRNILPESYSDFIFAIIVEEFGLLGGLGVLMLYLILLYRVGLIVRREKRSFPAFLAFGLTLLVVMQAMVNMCVAVNLIPVTGQTLPLVSRGGTSLFITSAAFGMILSVSRVQNKKELFDGEEPVKDNY